MKHKFRLGNSINDKDTKFIKKLLKKKPISIDGRYFNPNDCTVCITNIRKYLNSWFYGKNEQYVYEVDVVVSLKNKNFINYSTTRHRNDRIRRYDNEKKILDELSFFNVGNIQISKVTYEK